MSDVQTNDQELPENSSDEVVQAKAYKQVSTDMHKYKSEAKAYKAELAQLKADLEAKEMQTLKEQENWKQIAEKAQQKLSQYEQETQKERQKILEFHKTNAVVNALGGFKKTDYHKFINLDSVKVNDDGTIEQDSVLTEVDRIKREYSELIKTTPKQELPNATPKQGQPKDIKDMSESELAALRRELLK